MERMRAGHAGCEWEGTERQRRQIVQCLYRERRSLVSRSI